MHPRFFKLILRRDFGRCYHCGVSDDTLIWQHRKNRAMGGSKSADVASNLMTMCSAYNGLIESDAREAERARRLGWKLQSWQDPQTEPVFDFVTGEWFNLDNNFHRYVYDEKN
jgi:hypothetical protein